MRVSTRNLTFISRSRLSEVLHYPSVLSRTPGPLCAYRVEITAKTTEKCVPVPDSRSTMNS